MFWRKKPTPKTKERSLTPSPQSNPNPSLPEDLIVSILARVSRSYHTKLSLVSKSFRSILASPELHQTRTLLGRTETFLYVCLRFPDEANPRWFTLYRKKPNQTLTKNHKKKEDSSVHLLAPTPIPKSPHEQWLSLIAVGSYLYAITTDIHDSPCSNVWYIDCRTHTWLEAPRMRIAHTGSLYDGNVYLASSSERPDSLNCVQLYNTETQAWNPVPPTKRIFELEDLDGKIYLNLGVKFPWKTEAFKPKDMTSDRAGLHMRLGQVSLCRIDNVDYRYYPGDNIRWKHKTQIGFSKILEGLEGLPQFDTSAYVKLADYGGKLVVLWHNYVQRFGYKKKMICCAEISLEKRNTEEIWGKVEWLDEVLTYPKSYTFVSAKSATV